MIDVSVITLNYKEALLTKKCIDKLLKMRSVSMEIIVVDNSCDQKDKEILSSISNGKVKVFTMDNNLGCAKGYNFGIQKSKGKYIFIVNNDTEIDDTKALSKMLKFMTNNPKVAVLQPKIKSMRNPSYFEYAGAAGGYLDVLGYPFCRGRIFNTTEKDKGQYDNVVDITWASTCAFFARKNILKKVSLFDPIYFAYAEEVDICLKIWNLGFRIIFFPYTEVYHKGETSWKKIRGRKTFLIHRNHLILYFKCTHYKKLFLLLPQRLFYEAISVIYYLFNRSALHIFPAMLANIAVIILMPLILKKRKAFFKNYRENKMPIYRKSIIQEYFIHKKRYFNLLDRSNLYGY